MDKAEYQVKLDQLKTLVADQDYDGALDVVKGIDWRRVKNIRTLCMVADVYEANDMLEDSRRILLLALKRASIGKSILSRLVELCLMMNDTEGASEYYQEFIKAAPRDAARYLLQYKILKASHLWMSRSKHCMITKKANIRRDGRMSWPGCMIKPAGKKNVSKNVTISFCGSAKVYMW